jgi:hypothetical protein
MRIKKEAYIMKTQNGRFYCILWVITMNVNGLNSLIKRQRMADWVIQ